MLVIEDHFKKLLGMDNHLYSLEKLLLQILNNIKKLYIDLKLNHLKLPTLINFKYFLDFFLKNAFLLKCGIVNLKCYLVQSRFHLEVYSDNIEHKHLSLGKLIYFHQILRKLWDN